MSEPLNIKSAGMTELKAMALHYHSLGKDKPKDHEYNEKAEGLRFIYNAMGGTRGLLRLPRLSWLNDI